jgi:hypothetical protein
VQTAVGHKPLEQLAEGVPDSEVSAAVATRRVDRGPLAYLPDRGSKASAAVRTGNGEGWRGRGAARARRTRAGARDELDVAVGDQPLDDLAEGDAQSQVSASVAVGRDESSRGCGGCIGLCLKYPSFAFRSLKRHIPE